MRPGRPSRTAAHNALFRALEAQRPERSRVADDRLAIHFLPRDYRVLAELARFGPLRRLIETVIDYRWPGPRAGVVARTRLLDDTITAKLPAVEQVLILGAGFDTRPYRLVGMKKTRVFEIDHPRTQAVKERIVTHICGRPPGHVTFVPVVFGADDPAQRLAESGFVNSAPTLVLWEGVTNYLTAESVDDMFRFLGRVLGSSSPVLFTYVHAGMLDESVSFVGAAETMRHLRRLGEPFSFGFDPSTLPQYLAERAFQLVSDVAVSDAAALLYPVGRVPKTPAYYHVVEARRN